MNKNIEESEAAEGILLLSKDVGYEKSNYEVLGFLKSVTWEKEIIHSVFEMHDSGNKVIFSYIAQEKLWSCNVLAGNVRIFNRFLTQTAAKIIINNGTIINLGNLEFIFYYYKPKKPQKSYHKLICDAIESSTDKRMTLSQIYEYFAKNAGFSMVNASTWKNSIRHNLSLNKMFLKIPREKNELKGKGSFWEIDYNLKESYKFDGGSPTEIYDLNQKHELNKENIFKNKDLMNFSKNKKLHSLMEEDGYYEAAPLYEEKETEETPDILSLYQKPSKTIFNLVCPSATNPLKRKNVNNFSYCKKRKLNFLQIEKFNQEKDDSDKKTENRLIQLFNTEKVKFFRLSTKSKDRRSQSIAELSKEFDALSLMQTKQKVKKKRKFI